MSKKKKLLIFSIAALLVIGVIVLISQLTKEKPLEYTYNHSSNTVASIENGDYATYVKQLKAYLASTNKKATVKTLAVDDKFVSHASVNAQMLKSNITLDYLLDILQ